MELNIPIRAVKQKPIANMDFIRTCKETSTLSFHTAEKPPPEHTLQVAFMPFLKEPFARSCLPATSPPASPLLTACWGSAGGQEAAQCGRDLQRDRRGEQPSCRPHAHSSCWHEEHGVWRCSTVDLDSPRLRTAACIGGILTSELPLQPRTPPQTLEQVKTLYLLKSLSVKYCYLKLTSFLITMS